MTTTNKNTDWPVYGRTVPQLLISITLALVCALVANRLWQQDMTVTYENRLIENSQVLFLILATALHTLHASRQQADALTSRVCHQVLAMLCLSIMVREIDIDKLGPQAGWALAENLIRVVGGLVWLWLLVLIYQKRRWHWPRRGEILATPTSLLTGAGVLLYMASWFFDKSVVPLASAPSQLWEETLQLSGTIFLFTAGLHQIPLRKNYLADAS